MDIAYRPRSGNQELKLIILALFFGMFFTLLDILRFNAYFPFSSYYVVQWIPNNYVYTLH